MPRYPYERRYTPPAPVLPVRVGRPGAVPTVLVAAMVDTGADLSVLPRGLPAHLGLPTVGRLTVAGIDGLPRSLPVYAAEVAVEAYRTAIRVVSLGVTPLIGRDLLNKLVVHLRGPEATLDIDLPSPGG